MGFRIGQILGRNDVPELEASGVSADSRAVGRGELFFALPGTKVHGDAYVAAAEERGAVAVVSDRAAPEQLSIPVIVVPDVRVAYAQAAARVAGSQPSTIVAVTGTNGKTSVASFTRQIWQASGLPSASIGTLGVETAAGLETGSLTTPDPLSLHARLAGLKSQGVDHVALEASSHGLDQRRLDGLRVEAAGFTNLTRDHLDYHRDMDDYATAKLRLFTDLLAPDGVAVINTDDPEYGRFLRAAKTRGVRAWTVGRQGAFFRIVIIENSGFGQRVSGWLQEREVSFDLPLTGAFQVSNALVALGLAIATGVEGDAAIAATARLKGAKGRLELAGQQNGGAVFIDYAHTPDALQNALGSLRPYASGRLTVVFGCGGDRDRGKRPQMGAVAAALADRVIVTDDNPRTENAAAIRREILAAVPGATEIGDRTEAIRTALRDMGAGDVILVAGKGHEDYQIIGTVKHHFSDHEVVAEALRAA